MADKILVYPSDAAVRGLDPWKPDGDNRWRVDRVGILCVDQGNMNPPEVGEIISSERAPAGGSSTVEHQLKVTRARTVKTGTIRRVVHDVHRAGGFTFGHQIAALEFSASADDTSEEDESAEATFAETEEYTYQRTFTLQPGDDVYLVNLYRRIDVALYLEFEDHLVVEYSERGLVRRREILPEREAVKPWWSGSSNLVRRGRQPLGTMSYWSQLSVPGVVNRSEYHCAVPRPTDVEWREDAPPPRPRVNAEALYDSVRPLYDVVDYELWRLRRPPRALM